MNGRLRKRDRLRFGGETSFSRQDEELCRVGEVCIGSIGLEA